MFLYLAIPFFHQFQISKFHFTVKTIQCAFAYHCLNPFFRNGIAALKRLHHRVLTVNKLLVGVNLAIFILRKIRIQLCNGAAILRRNFIFLIAQCFPQFFEERRSINQLNFALALRALVLGENPDICSNAGVIKQVSRQRNNRLDQIVFQHPAANLTLAGRYATGEKGTAVFNNGSTAKVIVHLINGRLEEQHLHITRTGQSCAPAAIKTFLILCIDGIFHAFSRIFSTPSGAKRRIFQHKTHFRAFKAVCFHGVLITDIFGILPFDEHFSKAHGIGLRVDFLPEQAHICRGIIAFNKIKTGGQHTTRTTGLIQYCDDLTVIEDIIAPFSKQNIDHQLDNVATSVMVTSLGIFRKFANQIFKNVPHLHIVDGTRVKVKFGKCLDDRKQPIVFVHLVDFLAKIQTALLRHQNLQHIRREPLQVALEIGRDVVCVIRKFCKVKFAGIIELKARNTVHRLCRKIRI